jgi:adiponectin receptor
MAASSAKQAAELAVNEVSKVEKKIEEKLTVLWHEIESWQQDNQYIRSGYRPASNSYWRSMSSLSYLHNESVNIYTHLVGAVLAVIGAIVLYQILQPRYETATNEDLFVFGCFFFGAAACLGMSATYHTISNHSSTVASFGNKLDYLGILILIWGSHIPTIYYGFQKDERLLKVYWTMVCYLDTISLGTFL